MSSFFKSEQVQKSLTRMQELYVEINRMDYKKAQEIIDSPVGSRGRRDARLRQKAQAVVDATPQSVRDFEG